MSQTSIKHNIGKGASLLVVGIFAALFLLPTTLTFTNSLMSQQEILSNYGKIFDSEAGESAYISQRVNLKLIPDRVTFSQYATTMIKSPDYLLKFWNSVKLVVPIVFLQIAVASMAAYGFSRHRNKGREILFFAYVVLMLMPYQVTLVPNYLVAEKMKLLDKNLSIILPGVFAPFSVFILTKFMRRISVSIIEAAKIDGAGEWHIFMSVCLPMCKSVIFSVVMLVFIDYWNMVEQPIILLSNQEMHPLSVFLSKINSSDVGVAFAAATFYMIPAILLFLYGEDYLVEGIAYSGAVKG